MNSANSITHLYIKEIFDVVDGQFVRIKKTSKNIDVGAIAGCKRKDGYLVVRVNDVLHLAHRLSWFWHYGVWPVDLIDHIDGDKANNRIENLRESTKVTNGYNRGSQKNSSHGFKGVTFNKNNQKYMARISVNKKPIYLGYFDSYEKAHLAYCEASKKYHGEFAKT